MPARRAAFFLSLVLAGTLAACSPSTASPTASGGGSLTVTDAWARVSTGMEMAGAAYLTITNGTQQADALTGVTTPAAATAEIHETTEEASGMMAMHPVEKLEVAAGGAVRLEPGGYHVMLINLTAELEAGSTIELTLVFEKAGEVRVTAEVRAP